MLKEALAANTIGGKVDVESRRRAAQEDVRQAQASWSRIGPVADDAKRALAERFQRAVRQISGGWRGGTVRIAGRPERQTNGLPLPAALSIDLDQFHVEHEQAVGRAPALVREAFRNPEARLLAFDHQLQAFGPALDHAVERERRRLAA